MTEKEIKNLKINDKFTLELIVTGVDDIKLDTKLSSGYGFGCLPKKGNTIQSATLVKPAPTFEAGDTVRVIPDPMTGTVYGNGNNKEHIKGKTGIIKEPLQDGDLLLWVDGEDVFINIHCLELIKKAVKDKYTVTEKVCGWYVALSKNEDVCVARFYKAWHPNAESAAKTECERLNAEWRKQQEGGAE